MSNNKDTLGDRVKRYESVYNHTLTPRLPLIIRVDGKSFHTYTKGIEKPYSREMIDSMAYAALMTSQHMSGFKLAYVQSDEATFMLTDYDTLETQGWFGYELNKVVSLTASMFTGYFNKRFFKEESGFFDARAFVVPRDDWQNVFIWRQRDWERNSIQMLARHYYSQKDLHGKKIDELHQMIRDMGNDWYQLNGQLRNGTFITKSGDFNHERHTYDSLSDLVTE